MSYSSCCRFLRSRHSPFPLALSLADRRTATLAAERDRQLAALADAAAMPEVPLQRLVDRYHEVYGEGLLIIDSDGRTLAARGLGISEPGVAAAANHALVDAPASRWAPHSALGPATPSGRRGCPKRRGAGRCRRGGGRHLRSPRATSPTAGCGWRLAVLRLLVLAAVVARALTRWVLRPLDGLERAVAEMTEGVAGPPADVAGPPELRHFTSAFNTMAQVVRASLDRQRRLVADASHQLRNPLAAVRLRADSLENYVAEAGWSTYSSMTAELDRFENLLQQLLRLARAEQVSGSRKVGLSTAVAESDGSRRT